jgi:hypothetical protein
MKKFIETLIAAGFVAVAVSAQTGCSDLPSDAVMNGDVGNGDVGSVHLALSSATTVDIPTATYAITGPGGYTHGGMVTSTGGVLSGLVGGVPAGSGYTIELDGTSMDGTVNCSGTQMFIVVTHQTTQVTVPMVCRESLNGGSVSVSDTTDICPVVDGVAAAPMAAASGGTIALMGTAHDKDMGPSPLSYAWTATAGTFDSATKQNPTFTCPTVASPTMVTITLTVSDGGPMCTDSMQLTVTCG